MTYKNPTPAVDAVIFWRRPDQILLIKRKNPPLGYALPGGFVNEGESLEEAVVREVKEELGINIFLEEQFYTYSKPNRDPRKHIMSTVFLATATEEPKPGDDATEFVVVNPYTQNPLCSFDHGQIIQDVVAYKKYEIKKRLDIR